MHATVLHVGGLDSAPCWVSLGYLMSRRRSVATRATLSSRRRSVATRATLSSRRRSVATRATLSSRRRSVATRATDLTEHARSASGSPPSPAIPGEGMRGRVCDRPSEGGEQGYISYAVRSSSGFCRASGMWRSCSQPDALDLVDNKLTIPEKIATFPEACPARLPL